MLINNMGVLFDVGTVFEIQQVYVFINILLDNYLFAVCNK